MLPKTLQRFKDKLSGGMDEDPDGWKTIFTKPGYQFDTDAWHPMHVFGAATITELAAACMETGSTMDLGLRAYAVSTFGKADMLTLLFSTKQIYRVIVQEVYGYSGHDRNGHIVGE